MRPELVVSKCLLDEALTVVERPVDGDRYDTVAKRCHLRFLDIADLSFRVQHNHACIGHPVERLRHGAAGVAGCRDENGKRSPVGEVMKEPGLCPRADILEGQSWPVK